MESPGIPEELRKYFADKKRLFRINIADGVESLNSTVAASIALFDWGNKS